MPREGYDGQFNIFFPPEPQKNEDGEKTPNQDELEIEGKRIEAALNMAEEDVLKLEPADMEKIGEIIDEILKSRKKRIEKNISQAFLIDFISEYKKRFKKGVDGSKEVDEKNEYKTLVKIFSYLLMQKPGYVFSDSLLRFLEDRDSSILEKKKGQGGGGRPIEKIVKKDRGGSREKRKRHARMEKWGAGRGLPIGDID
jgi:hypothetical protein